MIHKTDVERLLGANTAKKGHPYWTRGAVTPGELSDVVVTGQVQGRERLAYEQEVILLRDEVSGHCSCPVAYNCKHVAALLYALAGDPDAFSATTLDAQALWMIPKLSDMMIPTTVRERIKALADYTPALPERLDALPPDALRQLVAHLMAHVDDSHRLVTRWLDHREDKPLPLGRRRSDLRRDLEAASRSTIGATITQHIHTIHALARAGQTQDALALAEVLTDWLYARTMERGDDYAYDKYMDSYASSFIMTLLNRLAQLITEGAPNSAALLRHIWEHYASADEDDWMVSQEIPGMLVQLAPRLDAQQKDHLLALIQADEAQDDEDLFELLLLLEDAPAGVSEAQRRWDRGLHKAALELWLGEDEVDVALTQALTLDQPWRHAELFAPHDHAVLALLERQFAQDTHHEKNLALSKLYTLYLKLERPGDALNAAVQRLQMVPRANIAAQVRAAAQRLNVWAELRPAIITLLGADPDELLRWHLEASELEEAAAVWGAHVGRVWPEELVDAMAAAAQARMPELAADALLRVAIARIELGGLDNYALAADALYRASGHAARAGEEASARHEARQDAFLSSRRRNTWLTKALRAAGVLPPKN